MLPSMRLCRIIAAVLKKDALFQAVAQEEYVRPWQVLIGFDGRRTDWEQKAPCAVIAPWQSDGAAFKREYAISFTLAVNDKRVDEEEGVFVLHGLAVLDERAWPRVWAAIQDALPGMEPTASLLEPSVAVNQEYAPMLLLHAGLAVEVNTPVGGRRL